jgi:CHAT domain-containing protein
MSKGEALRQAQIALLKGEGRGGAGQANASRAEIAGKAGASKADPARRYSHPYYWAPFILIGNWK